MERQNFTVRMQMRRFTWLTNAFSRKLENHAQYVALETAWFDLVRQHKAAALSSDGGRGCGSAQERGGYCQLGRA